MMKESPVAAAAEAESAAKATRSDQSDAPAEATKDPKAQQGAGPAVDAKASEVPASEVAIIAEVEKVIAAIRPAVQADKGDVELCLLYTSPSPRDGLLSRMPSSA